jgi:plastocyanin
MSLISRLTIEAVHRMMRSHRWSLVGLAFLLAGCGDGPAGTGETPPSSVAVDVGNIFFQSARNGSMDPAVDTVAAGGTVTWTWIEAGTHTVRLEDAGLPESPEFTDNGSVFSMPFPAAGTYAYDCGVHGPVMAGTIVVK